MTDATPGVTGNPPAVDDRRLIGRLMNAFLHANESACYGEGSLWKAIRGMQEAVAAAIRDGNVEAVASALRRPHEGYLFYGFEDLGVWSVEAYRDENRRTWYAIHCHEVLQRLARAMGVLAVANPESPDVKPDLPSLSILLDRIEAGLGISITPPEPYPHYYGLQTDRGILGERVLNAAYCAWRIRHLTRGIAKPRILEIGAGLGRVAEYCSRFGLTDYWIVDIPLTSLAQGHFLAFAMGEDHVVLDGEAGAERTDAVKIINSERFFADPSLEFDLVVNIDSLTELGRDLATRYLTRVADRSATFFSINHEINEFTVATLCREMDAFDAVQRSPYWLRAGYVEEVWTTRRTAPMPRGGYGR